MSYRNLSIPERLLFSKDTIQIVLSDPMLTQAFAEVGYTSERFSDALVVQKRASGYWMTQQVEYGERLKATSIARELYRSVIKRLRNDRRIVQIALENSPGLFEQLRMARAIESKRDRAVLQALHFYNEAIEMTEIHDHLAAMGLHVEVLQERYNQVIALNEALQRQQHQRGQAIVMTQQRREVMESLDKWVIQFLAIARAIFKEDAEQMKKLGLPL